MGRPKSRQAPRKTMTIRVSERERRQIEEKAVGYRNGSICIYPYNGIGWWKCGYDQS